MNDHFYNPRNAAAALWASSAERAARTLNPDLSTNEIRNLPMMRGVYKQLRAMTAGQLLEKPAPDASKEDIAAWLSQHFLIGGTVGVEMKAATDYSDIDPYQLYLYAINHYNDNHDIADFSTDDILGFALCLIIWYIVNQGTAEVAELNLVKDFLIDFVALLPIPGSFLLEFINAEVEALAAAIHAGMGTNADFAYRSPSYTDSHSSSPYVALNWKMPDDAQVIMLGDWGTGMDDAKAFLKALWKKAYQNLPSRQIVFIHLGDIYYCGLPEECENYFYDIFQSVASELSTELAHYSSSYPFDPRPPIFTIPGNHEYYSNGAGYFKMLDKIFTDWNGGNQNKRQRCSFFCLRSNNGRWQFLGMDTGQADHDALSDALRSGADIVPINKWVGDIKDWVDDWPSWVPSWIKSWPESVLQVYYNVVGPHAPALQKDEASWHQNRLKSSEFSGSTILLSHHQLFSQEAKIDYNSPQYLNLNLKKVFSPSFGSTGAWFWGHEHTYAMYKDGQQGLNKGRLLGSSAYEATNENDTPYANNYPNIQFSPDMFNTYYGGQTDPVKIIGQNSSGLLSHAAAILTFDDNTHDVQVDYYTFPAWSQLDSVPTSPSLTLIATESISHDSDDYVSLSPSWIGNRQATYKDSHNNTKNFDTESAPSAACFNKMLYVAYRNESNNLAWFGSDIENYKPTASSSSSQSPTWQDHGQIEFGGSPIATGHSIASLFANNVWYIFYVNTSNHVALITCTVKENGRTWKNVGELLDGSNTIKTTSACTACFYEGKIYVVYLDDDQNSDKSYNVKSCSYDPLQTGNMTAVVRQGILQDSTGKTITGIQVAATGYSGSKGGDDNFMMLVTMDKDGDIKWTKTTDPDSNTSYSEWTIINTTKANSHGSTTTDDLKSSAGVSLNYFRGAILMVRVDGSQYLKAVVFDLKEQKWYGDDPVDIHANDTSKSAEIAQSSHFPSLAVVPGGLFLIYRGNTNNEIYWCYS